LSETARRVRAEKKKALAARDYSRAAIERRREKELARELDERLRRWRVTVE
jgi:hypothetical protein